MVATLIAKVQIFVGFVLLCNRLRITENGVQWVLDLLDDNWGDTMLFLSIRGFTSPKKVNKYTKIL